MTPSECKKARRVVRGIILDAGGVILHPDLDWIAAQVIDHGATLSRQQLLEGYYRTMHEVDHLPESVQRQGTALTSLEIRRWFFGRMLALGGLGEAAAAIAGPVAELAQRRFPRESDIYHWALPGIRQRLLALRRAGFLLAVASNNDGALEAQLQSVSVRDLFGPCLDSGVEGVAKPDPELVLRAARALGLDPARCVFVGDVDRIDGAAARAAGVPFALLDPLLQPRPARPLLVPDLTSLLEHFAAES